MSFSRRSGNYPLDPDPHHSDRSLRSFLHRLSVEYKVLYSKALAQQDLAVLVLIRTRRRRTCRASAPEHHMFVDSVRACGQLCKAWVERHSKRPAAALLPPSPPCRGVVQPRPSLGPLEKAERLVHVPLRSKGPGNDRGHLNNRSAARTEDDECEPSVITPNSSGTGTILWAVLVVIIAAVVLVSWRLRAEAS